jgi:hypothetical protein
MRPRLMHPQLSHPELIEHYGQAARMVAVWMRIHSQIDGIGAKAFPNVINQLLTGVFGSTVDHDDGLVATIAAKKVAEPNRNSVAALRVVADRKKVHFVTHTFVLVARKRLEVVPLANAAIG